AGLVVSAADFAQITAGTIDIGSLDGGSTITAGAISIISGITIPGTTTLGLFAAGGVVEAGGSIAGGGSLIGQADSFALAGGNTIAALGPIVSAQGFTLNDTGALDVVGAIQAGSVGTAGAVSIVDAGTLSLDAGISATVGSAVTTGVSLVTTGTGNGIAQNSGTIATDGAVTLAASGTLQQGAGAAILASGGTIGLSGPTGIALAGSVAAAANNVFVQAGTGAGVTLAATGTLSAGGVGSLLLVQGDTLTVAAGAALLATGGTVAIAPTSAMETSFGTTTPGLQLGTTVAAAISAAELRIGGYADPSGTNQVTASGISLDQSVDLTGHAATLRLDANGAIAQTAGSLAVGTLSASSNGAASGAIILNALGNDVTALGNVTVGSGDGDFSLTDAAPVLTLPASATVYADNVMISNAGSVVIAGNLAATTGTLTVTTGAGDIVVEAPALIGAATAANFGATGAFTQTGGVIDAQDIGIVASNGDVTQSGGTIFATAFDTAPGGLSVLGSGGLTQSAGAVLASDGALYINMPGSVSLAGSVLAFGPATVGAGTSLTSSGLAAAEGDLSLTGTGALTQTGGTIASGGTLALASDGALTQTAGAAYGATVSLSASAPSSFPSLAGALGLTKGSGTVVAVTAGAVSPGAPPIASGTTLTLPSLAAGGPGTLNHLVIDVENAADPAAGSYTITAPLAVTWVELHTSGALTESGGGAIDATLFSGSAGMTSGSGFATAYTNDGTTVVSSASLTGANTIAHLGSFTASGSFVLDAAPGTALDVIGAVQAGAGSVGGQTLALAADSLTVDGSGTPVTIYPGETVFAAGSLVAGAAIAGGTIRPGQIQLVTDNLSLILGGTTLVSALVSAPDGSVAIAPRTAGVIALGGISTPGTLGLSNALLNDITTLGTSTGPAGTETLLIGSLDGVTSAVGAIDINSGIVLGTVARTLDLVASGTVAEFTGGALSVTALAGTAAAFTLDTGANTIAELGNATARTQGGTLYQTSGYGAQTSLVADGDIRLNDTASLTVVGPVIAGLAVQPDTLELSAPSIDIVTGPTVTLGTGTIAAAGALLANGALAGGTLDAGLIALQTDALSIQGTLSGGNPVPIVVAPGGEVAIAPNTAGAAMSIDATAGSTTGTLSVAASSLGFVSTFGTLAVPGVAPAGAETLVLGSIDGGATQRAGSIAFTTPLDLRNTATTLALFTSGTVSQAIGAGITVGA
ncbi:MAG: beta strand repeat-containing protein, partial [Acetobacteraceae bacterium]